MSDKNNEYILELMQNVSDKLEDISIKLNENSPHIKAEEMLLHTNTHFEGIINNQKIIAEGLCVTQQKLDEVLNKVPSTINQNQQTNYILFGKDTPFTSKLLLSIVAVILLSIPMFKYIPTYVNEKSRITEERDNYKLFHDYVFLNAFDNRKTVPTDLIETFNIIKSKDSAFLNYVDRLHSKYDTHLKKENLKAELQKLQE